MPVGTMAEHYIPIDTDVGVVCGRDAIYLDEIQFDYAGNIVKFLGGINGHLCSRNTTGVDFCPTNSPFSECSHFTRSILISWIGDAAYRVLMKWLILNGCENYGRRKVLIMYRLGTSTTTSGLTMMYLTFSAKATSCFCRKGNVQAPLQRHGAAHRVA